MARQTFVLTATKTVWNTVFIDAETEVDAESKFHDADQRGEVHWADCDETIEVESVAPEAGNAQFRELSRALALLDRQPAT